MADDFELSRRQFGSGALATFLAGWMSTVAPSLRAQEPANDDQPPAQPKPDHHLPADYRELFKLSAEQKVLISALVASGGDAVAYYTPRVKKKASLPLISNSIFIRPKTQNLLNLCSSPAALTQCSPKRVQTA